MDNRVRELFEELNFPSADRLLKALKLRGIPAQAKDVKALVQEESARQVQAPTPLLKGKITAKHLHEQWFADLIDFTQAPSAKSEKHGAPKYILVVQDVFSREIWAEPLPNKTPVKVAQAFEAILEEVGTAPKKLTTDKGGEFAREFRALAEARGIEYRVKDNQRQIATIDVAIGGLKKAMARDARRAKTDDWASRLDKVVKGQNKAPNTGEYLDGEAPADVAGDAELVQKLEEKNQEYIEHNRALVDTRAEKLREAGHFRTVKNRPANFARGWQPKWSEEVHEVDSVAFDTVTDTQGRRFKTKFTLPVHGHTETGGPRRIERGGSAQTQAKIRERLDPFAQAVAQHFGAGASISLTRIGQYLRKQEGFRLALSEARVNQKAPIAGMLRAFPDLFTMLSPTEARIRPPLVNPSARRLRRLL